MLFGCVCVYMNASMIGGFLGWGGTGQRVVLFYPFSPFSFQCLRGTVFISFMLSLSVLSSVLFQYQPEWKAHIWEEMDWSMVVWVRMQAGSHSQISQSVPRKASGCWIATSELTSLPLHPNFCPSTWKDLLLLGVPKKGQDQIPRTAFHPVPEGVLFRSK